MLENFPENSGISLKDGKHDRWLGFVQGALWAMDLKDIDSFRDDVRKNNGFNQLKKYLGV